MRSVSLSPTPRHAFAVVVHRCLDSSNREVRLDGLCAVRRESFRPKKQNKNARTLLPPPLPIPTAEVMVLHVGEGSEAAPHVANKNATRARAGGDERTVARRFNVCRKQSVCTNNHVPLILPRPLIFCNRSNHHLLFGAQQQHQQQQQCTPPQPEKTAVV